MMTLEDLLLGPLPGAMLTSPAMDPLREAGALQEAQLLDIRLAVTTSTVGLLFEMRTALQLREGNTAVLVGYQVQALDWTAEPMPRMTAWTVVGSQPTDEGLTLDFYPTAHLRLVAGGSAFYVIDVPRIGNVPPSYVEDDAAAIHAGLPHWSSPFSPLHATYIP
jgi:hypothetical protein